MSASTKIICFKKFSILCQNQSYARTTWLYRLHSRMLSLETSLEEDAKTDQKVLKSGPGVKSFPTEVELDPAIVSDLESNMMKVRKHPGRLAGKTSQLPSYLEEAANMIVEKYSSNYKLLRENAEALKLFIAVRVAPREGPEYRKKLEKIYNRLAEKELEKHESLGKSIEEEHLEELQEKLQKQALIEAAKAGFTWKPLLLNAESGLVYMVARLAQNYSVMLQIFNEMKKREPSFIPGAIYNFGSGVGSVIWAANSVWHDKIFEYYCVDQSGHMNTLARLLLQGGSEDNKMCIPGVYFRQFHSSDKAKYKMVVCAYTLLEMVNKKERLDLITSLWNKTEDYLVLVEVGNAAGYQVILEARDHILNLKNKKQGKQTGDLEGHVFAPCTHDSTCPKLEYHKNYCHFQTYYKPLHLGQGPRKEDKQVEKYSYVVLKKGHRQEEDSWPRITYTILKKSRHLHCHLCCPDGTLRHFLITKNQDKYSKYLYKCARGSEWGDRLPVKWPCKRLEDPEGSSSASNPVKEKHNLTRSELQQGDLSVETDSTRNSSEEKVTQLDPSQTKTHLDFVQVVK